VNEDQEWHRDRRSFPTEIKTHCVQEVGLFLFYQGFRKEVGMREPLICDEYSDTA